MDQTEISTLCKLGCGLLILSIGSLAQVEMYAYRNRDSNYNNYYPDNSGIQKLGECPPSDEQMDCYVRKDLCYSDCDCPLKEKCCFQENCGMQCKNATTPKFPQPCNTTTYPHTKTGQCAPEDPNIECFACIDQCVSDCECKEDQICCQRPNCGNQCEDSV